MGGLFFFKQKPAYEMRISDWSSDVCSSDLHAGEDAREHDVSKAMPPAIGRIDLRRARAHDNVELVFQQAAHNPRRGGSVIATIAIRTDIDVGANIGEHAADEIAITPHTFPAQHWTSAVQGQQRSIHVEPGGTSVNTKKN